MTSNTAWQEVESKVHRPGLALVFLAGIVFTAIPCILLLCSVPAPNATAVVLLRGGAAIFALFGGAALLYWVRAIAVPVYIHHAAADVLPDVPTEPLTVEGSIVHGRLTHELRETDTGWELRPAGGLRRNDRRFLVGFGVPFLVLFAGLLTWTFSNEFAQQGFLGWMAAAVAAVTLTALCVGSALLIIGAIHRASFDRLAKLTIPANGGELNFECSRLPDLKDGSLAAALKFIFGPTGKNRLQIRRDLATAVQLCPWKYSAGESNTWAVQGLLVLRSLTDGAYHRVPLFLTGDCVGAARLMQRLADVLHVPYLFHADAAGWKAESIRASRRPPLRAGGSMS